MAWSNPITDVLWYSTSPLPGFITAEGPNFILHMSGTSFQGSTLAEAQAQYQAICIAQLVPPFTISPQLPEFTLPTDGELVAGTLIGGGWFFGIWSHADQDVAQAAATIPLANILAWTSLPS